MSNVHGGFFSLTEITDTTQHRAYNEWHQLDHMPEQFQLDGVQHGQRWVLTPRLRAQAVMDPPFDRIHYFTMYLMSEPLESTLTDFHQLGQRLHDEGRWFDPRRSHFARPAIVEQAQSGSTVRISSAAIPFRPHTGIHAIIEAIITIPADRIAAIAALPGVVGVWSFTTSKRFDALPWGAGEYRVTVAWLDDDVEECAVRFHQWMRQPRNDFHSVVFAATLQTITPWHWTWFDNAVADSQSTKGDK